jgi:hypothetical protein
MADGDRNGLEKAIHQRLLEQGEAEVEISCDVEDSGQMATVQRAYVCGEVIYSENCQYDSEAQAKEEALPDGVANLGVWFDRCKITSLPAKGRSLSAEVLIVDEENKTRLDEKQAEVIYDTTRGREYAEAIFNATIGSGLPLEDYSDYIRNALVEVGCEKIPLGNSFVGVRRVNKGNLITFAKNLLATHEYRNSVSDWKY